MDTNKHELVFGLRCSSQVTRHLSLFAVFLLALSPTFVSAQSVDVFSSAHTNGAKPKPTPRPKPTPKPTPAPAPNPDPNYTRTAGNTSGTADQWSAGTNWDATPTSGTATQLVFGGAVPASLATGVNVFTNNDVAGDFKLNILDFTYAGPASGIQPTVTISGNRLEFINNGATPPTLNLNAGGTIKPLLTISNALLLTNNLTATANSDGILSGVISGTGGLTKLGNGELDLTGGSGTDNTYTGLTTVSAGTLGLGKGGTTAAFGGDLLINGGNVLYSATNNNQIPDTAKVTLTSGTLAFGARTENVGVASTPASGLTMSGGTLTIGSGSLRIANSSITGGAISMTAGGEIRTLTDLNFSGGAIDFATSASAAAINLRGGTGTGITYLASGTSTAQITSSGGGGLLDLNTTSGAVTVFNIGNSPSVATEMSIGVKITGTASQVLQKTGDGVLVLSGTNTYLGPTKISGGTLEFAKQVSLYNNNTGNWTATNVIVESGATLALNVGGTGEFTSANVDTLKALGTATGGFKNGSFLGLDTTNASGGTFTYSSNIGNPNGGANSLGVIKMGSGTLVLSGVNSYTGGTTVNDGLLQLNSSSALGSTSGSLTVNAASGNAAILDLNGNSISVGNLTGTGGNIWNNGPNAASSAVTLTIGTGNTGGGNYQGVISNNNGAAPLATVALTKIGTGTITLSGANTYTGATSVNGGTLFVNGSLASGSAVSVTNSGSVLGGTGTINGPVTVNANAAILGGTGVTGQTLTLANSLTMNSSSVIELALGASGAHSALARTGSGTWSFQAAQAFNFIDLGATAGTTYDNIITGLASDPLTEGTWTIQNAGWVGIFTYDGGVGAGNIDLTLAAVPEPSTWIAGGLALMAVCYTQRRRFARLLARA